MKVLINQAYYVIELKREDGTTFLASGGDHCPIAMFFYARAARKHLRALKEHNLRGRVIKADVTITAP